MRDNETNEVDLVIDGLNGKIGILERRRDYLRRKLRNEDYAATTGADFDRHEIGALNAAVRALRFHGATLSPETDPVVHLARLADAIHNRKDPVEVARITREARAAVKELM